jgi:hypothetical protein
MNLVVVFLLGKVVLPEARTQLLPGIDTQGNIAQVPETTRRAAGDIPCSGGLARLYYP